MRTTDEKNVQTEAKTEEKVIVSTRNDVQSFGELKIHENVIVGHYIEMGIVEIESNPELEYNKDMHNLWADFEKEQHKRRRAFKKELV